MTTFKTKSKPLGFVLVATFIVVTVLLIIGLVIVSYLTFNTHTDRATRIQTDEISRQIVFNYESYSNEIIATSNTIQSLAANTDLSSDTVFMTSLLENITLLNPKYIDISIYNLTGVNLVSSSADAQPADISDDWFIGAIADSTTHYFSTPYRFEDSYRLVISKYITLNRYQDYAILKLHIDFSNLVELTQKSNLGQYGHISIVNSDYEYVYSSKVLDHLSNDEELSIFRQTILGSTHVYIQQNLMYFTIETITNTPWRIGVFININENALVRQNFLFSSLGFSGIFMLTASLIFLGIANRMTYSLVSLQKTMQTVEKQDDLNIESVDLKYPREVESLSHTFNVMIDRIKRLMQNVIKEQDAQRKSELKALQNQINPHFLYNTLDSIVWMVENHRNDEAAEMLMALSKFFKISVSKGQNIISVKDELEHARNYLFIQSIRYKDKFSYEIVVDDPNVLSKRTMKLILQPLIENAIYHGITKLNHQGKITVRVDLKEDFIKFSVSDNGYGMTDEKIKALYHQLEDPDLKDSVGMKNIYQRLFVYYQNKASLNIVSVADEGTTIEILIPSEDIL